LELIQTGAHKYSSLFKISGGASIAAASTLASTVATTVSTTTPATASNAPQTKVDTTSELPPAETVASSQSSASIGTATTLTFSTKTDTETIQTSSTSSITPLNTASPNKNSKKALSSGGKIAVGVSVSFGAVLLAIVGIGFLWRRKLERCERLKSEPIEADGTPLNRAEMAASSVTELAGDSRPPAAEFP
jgi:hypothetical protein